MIMHLFDMFHLIINIMKYDELHDLSKLNDEQLFMIDESNKSQLSILSVDWVAVKHNYVFIALFWP